MARAPVLVLGGTFDHLHIGHEALLNSAFRLGRTVGIGLTTEEFLRERAKPLGALIPPYARRRQALAGWIRRHHPGRTWWIAPLEDPFGRSIEPGVDAIVVSGDTAQGGRAVNRERRRRGLPPVAIHLVPLVLADDLQPVSSRRVRARIIDRTGRRLSRIRIRARVPTEARADVRAALKSVYRRPAVHWAAPGAVRAARPRPIQHHPPAEVELGLRRGPRPARRWALTVRAGGIRLPPVGVPSGPSSALRRAIAQRLRPRPTAA